MLVVLFLIEVSCLDGCIHPCKVVKLWIHAHLVGDSDFERRLNEGGGQCRMSICFVVVPRKKEYDELGPAIVHSKCFS